MSDDFEKFVNFDLLIAVPGETPREEMVRRMRYIKNNILWTQKTGDPTREGVKRFLCGASYTALNFFCELMWTEEFICDEMHGYFRDFVSPLLTIKWNQQPTVTK